MRTLERCFETAAKFTLKVFIGGFVAAFAFGVAVTLGTDQQTGNAVAEWGGRAVGYLMLIGFPVAFLWQLAAINLNRTSDSKETSCDPSDDS